MFDKNYKTRLSPLFNLLYWLLFVFSNCVSAFIWRATFLKTTRNETLDKWLILCVLVCCAVACVVLFYRISIQIQTQMRHSLLRTIFCHFLKVFLCVIILFVYVPYVLLGLIVVFSKPVPWFLLFVGLIVSYQVVLSIRLIVKR